MFKMARYFVVTQAQDRVKTSYLLILTEPVDVEDLWHLAPCLRHRQPVTQVLAKVVSEERTHCERVMHYYFTLKETNSLYEIDANFKLRLRNGVLT